MLNSLNVAQSGLNAAKISVENVMNNIANENTPGYKKRSVQLNELAHLDSRIVGRGSSVGGVSRATANYMYDNLITETSKENYYQKSSTLLEGVESLFKETDKSGFTQDLNRYFQSVENLRSNPSSEVYKNDMKTQGSIIVDSLKRLYEGIEKQQELEVQSLNDDIKTVNGILQDIGKINEQLGQQVQASNELLDKRDALEEELSKYIDIEVERVGDDYTLKVGGATAVRHSTNVRDITLIEEYTPQKDRFIQDDGVTSNILVGITFDANDEITYKLDNEHSVSVTYGESLTFDWNGDGTATTDTVDENNYVRAMVYKINNNTGTAASVKAYNGSYATDIDGNKSTIDTSDKYLLIESITDGLKGQFSGQISIVEKDNANPAIIENRKVVYRDDSQSNEPTKRIGISVYDKEIPVSSGSMKAQIENLSSISGSNKFESYKDQLDNFARTLSDMTDQFIRTGDESFVYGELAIDDSGATHATSTVRSLGLFSGSDVATLSFDKDAVNELDQVDLDYLATMQFKKDVYFNGKPQGSTTASYVDDDQGSLAEFFQSLRVGVSADKENNDFLKETQEAVKQSIQSNYDQIVKVDNDEEMLNLIKFQAAYTANAKVVTVVDEMIQTILGIKR
mgnify:CR=1 FL=1